MFWYLFQIDFGTCIKKKMGVLKPVFFIFFQTCSEISFFICHILQFMFEDSKILHFLTYFWVFQYLYTLWSFSAASFLDPGFLTDHWEEEAKRDPNYKNYDDENDPKFFCKKCNMKRPQRCHHCSDCNKCVLLYDHHCEFTDNCVGQRNYRAFFIFLLVFPLHTVTTVGLGVYSIFKYTMTGLHIFVFFVNALYFLVFGVVVLMQLSAQFSFLLHDSTWIEQNFKETNERFYKKAGVKQVDKYNINTLENIKIKLGHNPWLWIFPIANNEKIYSFKINPEYVPVTKLHITVDDIADEKTPLIDVNRVIYRPRI